MHFDTSETVTLMQSMFQVEMLVKNPRLAIPEVNRITKKKGGMVDSGMKNIFERRGRIVAKPPPGAGDAYSTDKAHYCSPLNLGGFTRSQR